MNPRILLQIVQTWNLNPNPEYRGFRCANCQKYMRKAWYHWLTEGGYKTPVHFCNDCEEKFKSNKIKINKPKIVINRSRFKLSGEKKDELMRLPKKWNTKVRPIYKMFTCDSCNRDMYRAYHIWLTEKGNLIEVHLCKKCGEKMGFSKIIKGIIYDLDGTLISTLKLHRDAWLAAGQKFSMPITEEMLKNQSGISDEEAALMMLPEEKKYLLKKFIDAKQKYVRENIKKVSLFPGTIETINALIQKGYKVWICTSAHKFFATEVLSLSWPLKKVIGNNIIWREMYKHAKPSPDALNLTINKMGLAGSQVCYIGDAFSDYKTSVNTGVKFIYFRPNVRNSDSRIPKLVSVISSPKEIFKLLK